MSLREHSFLKRCFAVLALAAWLGAFHHDAFLALMDLDHHHDHHVAADQAHHDRGHSHSDEPDHDHRDSHRDSIPLPDTHSEPVTLSVAKVGVDGPKQVVEADSWFFVAMRLLLSGSSDSDFDHPPPKGVSDFHPPALILLAHSVQSNAPPSLS